MKLNLFLATKPGSGNSAWYLFFMFLLTNGIPIELQCGTDWIKWGSERKIILNKVSTFNLKSFRFGFKYRPWIFLAKKNVKPVSKMELTTSRGNQLSSIIFSYDELAACHVWNAKMWPFAKCYEYVWPCLWLYSIIWVPEDLKGFNQSLW